MGGKPVVEMAKQIDAEMDKSGYVPPPFNKTFEVIFSRSQSMCVFACADRREV